MIAPLSEALGRENASGNSDTYVTSSDNSCQAIKISLYSCNLVASLYKNQLLARVTTELSSGGTLNNLFSLLFHQQVLRFSAFTFPTQLSRIELLTLSTLINIS